jgi:hypothetical protein
MGGGGKGRRRRGNFQVGLRRRKEKVQRYIMVECLRNLNGLGGKGKRYTGRVDALSC